MLVGGRVLRQVAIVVIEEGMGDGPVVGDLGLGDITEGVGNPMGPPQARLPKWSYGLLPPAV